MTNDLPVTEQGSTKDVMEELNALGFHNTFKMKHRRLMCCETEETFGADQLQIFGTYRYEGPSDPADEQVIYALQANDGTKGILTDAFGTYSDPEIGEFIGSVHDVSKESRH